MKLRDATRRIFSFDDYAMDAHIERGVAVGKDIDYVKVDHKGESRHSCQSPAVGPESQGDKRLFHHRGNEGEQASREGI